MSPQISTSLSIPQAIKEPCFLFRSKNRSWRLILTEVRNLCVRRIDHCRGMAIVIGASGIKDVKDFLRHESRKVVAHKSLWPLLDRWAPRIGSCADL